MTSDADLPKFRINSSVEDKNKVSFAKARDCALHFRSLRSIVESSSGSPQGSVKKGEELGANEDISPGGKGGKDVSEAFESAEGVYESHLIMTKGAPFQQLADKARASAQDFLRNLEGLMPRAAEATPSSSSDQDEGEEGERSNNNNNKSLHNKEGSSPLEQAFRALIASCTGGGAVESTQNTEEQRHVPTRNASSTESPSKLSRRRSNPAPSSPRSVTRNKKVAPQNQPPPYSSQPQLGEHIYEQLFFDSTEKARAEKAVHAVQANHLMQQPLPSTKPLVIPKPFHVSSPGSTKKVCTEDLHIPANLTFDDGISAISAHTLEAMALQHQEQGPSNDHNKDFRKTHNQEAEKNVARCNPFQAEKTPGKQRPAPVVLQAPPPKPAAGRFPSPLPIQTRRSTSTKASSKSHSTPTTESTNTSFELWQRQEADFWEHEVQIDKKKGDGHVKKSALRRSRGRTRSRSSLSRAVDSTFSTASSTMSGRHPHETFPFQARDVVFNAAADFYSPPVRERALISDETGEI